MTASADGPGSPGRFIAFLVLLGIIAASCTALGVWQVDRLAWKTALMAAVDVRSTGEARPAPLVPVNEDDTVYLRVHLQGEYRHAQSIRVKALTDLGAGHWIMTPLVTEETAVWINRGFAPGGMDSTELNRPSGVRRVVGLLRMTEPEGTLLERNDPDNDRWFSRDVMQMSAANGMTAVVNFFVDAEHEGAPNAWPRGGLTRVAFRNTHLSYAITWFVMAALALGASGWLITDRRRNKIVHDV